MVMAEVELAMGVPEMIPLEESRARPEGNWPDMIFQVTAEEAPCTCRVKEKGTV
jgi:hypothetical protein